MSEAISRNFGARSPRRTSWVDEVIDNGIAFIQRVAKQMMITVIVSAFKAAADFILSKSDDAVSSTLRGNLGETSSYGNTNNSYRGSSYASSQYDNDYYNRYDRRNDPSTAFPGFGG